MAKTPEPCLSAVGQAKLLLQITRKLTQKRESDGLPEATGISATNSRQVVFQTSAVTQSSETVVFSRTETPDAPAYSIDATVVWPVHISS